MAAKKEVTFVIRARDATRGVFRRVRNGLNTLRSGIFGLRGAFLGLGIGAAVRGALNFATSMEAASRRVNVSTDTLQALRLEAADLGIRFESLVTFLQRIQTNAGRAVTGSEELEEAFRFFGISLRDLQTLAPEELLFRLGEAIERIGPESVRARAALSRIGDTEGVALIALLAQGRALRTVNERRAEAIQKQEDLTALTEAEAEARQELAQLQAEASQALVRLLPELTKAANALVDALEAWRELSQSIGENAPTPIDVVNRANQAGNVPVQFLQNNTPQWVLDMNTHLSKIRENTEDFGELS